MKIITITFALLIAAIGLQAQAVRIKSKSTLADSIWINRGAIEVQPFLTGSDSTTVRSIDYIFHPNRDTLLNLNVEVKMYDKSATLISSTYIIAPGNIFLKWTALINKVDNYILKKRLNKQN
jgi:hypothetical protein